MLAEYMQEERERFRLGTDTKQMLAQLRTSMKLIDNRKDIVREKIVISTKLLHHFESRIDMSVLYCLHRGMFLHNMILTGIYCKYG